MKKVEQTALGCQQPQLLPTMLPIFILIYNYMYATRLYVGAGDGHDDGW